MTDGRAIRVRPTAAADVPAVRTVAEDAWRAAYDFLAPDTITAAMAEWYDPTAVRERVTDPDPDREHFVAELPAATTPVGYLGGGGVDDESALARVGALNVASDHWGRGVGSALLERFHRARRDRGDDRVQLRVLAENERGRAFYRARGYELIGEETADLFGETVTEAILRRSL